VPDYVKRDRLVRDLDEYLRIGEIADSSPNGLQVQGAARVSRVAFAVDACRQTIRAAVRARAQMLLVHHGLWWGEHEQIVGNMHARVSDLIHAELSLYAAHLPLDCHPEVGNNVELARLFGLEVRDGFGEYRGTRIGLVAQPPGDGELRRDDLLATIGARLGRPPEALTFGPDRVRRVAILSGSGAMFAEEARRAGCDTLVTGESSHSAYHMAKESGVNLVFAGHYATETVGVRALARRMKKLYPITTKFISVPTGY
jgi:dinuclear metal center YbgI/SA1388 family protein